MPSLRFCILCSLLLYLPLASAGCPSGMNLVVFGDFLSLVQDKARPCWPSYITLKSLRDFSDPAATAMTPVEVSSSTNAGSTLAEQVSTFLKVRSPLLRKPVAVAVWIGLNDLFNALPTVNLTNSSAILALMTSVGEAAAQSTCNALLTLVNSSALDSLFLFTLPQPDMFTFLFAGLSDSHFSLMKDALALGISVFNLALPDACNSFKFRRIDGTLVFSEAIKTVKNLRGWTLGPCGTYAVHNITATCQNVVWYDTVTPTPSFQRLMANNIKDQMCGDDDGGMTYPTDTPTPTATHTTTFTASQDGKGGGSPQPISGSNVLLWLLLLLLVLPMLALAAWFLFSQKYEVRRRTRRTLNVQIYAADLDPTDDLTKDRSADTASGFAQLETGSQVGAAASSNFREGMPKMQPALNSLSVSLDAQYLSPTITLQQEGPQQQTLVDSKVHVHVAQSSVETAQPHDDEELRDLQSEGQSAGDTSTFATNVGTFENLATSMQLPINLDMDIDLPEVQVVQHRKGLGSGANGQVYTGTHLTKGTMVAIKVIAARPDSIPRVKQEIQFLYKMQHENIVKCFGYFLSPGAINIVMEYVPRTLGQAIQELHKVGCMAEAVIKEYTAQILRGAKYIHSCNVVHRDLKPANVLVDTCGTCKIADFGCSKELSTLSIMHSCVGTPQYMAPELMFLGTSHFGSDVWSIACIAYEMITGRAPWYHILENSEVRTAAQFFIQVARVHGGPLRPEDHIAPDAVNFLGPCFSHEPEDRPSCAVLLECQWLSGGHPETAPLAP